MQSLYGAIANYNKKINMVRIDEVYQQVLALANKEQRGYITPQEFNLYANQAQIDIFNQYFFDLNQFKRVPASGNNYSDIADLINDKLSIFKTGPEQFTSTNNATLPDDCYKVTSVNMHQGGVHAGEAQKVNYEEWHRINQSPLTKPKIDRPLYYIADKEIHVSPSHSSLICYFRYIRIPSKVNWAYVVVNEKPLFNSTLSIDFELHDSEQKNLVVKILQLAGVGIKDYNIVQAAGQEEVKKIQQEKS